MSLKIYLANDLPGRHFIHYTLQLIAFNKGVAFTYTDSPSDAALGVGDRFDSGILLCTPFYQYLTSQDFSALKDLAQGSYYFYDLEGGKDLLASIFYLVNSLQEYAALKLDLYGRFPYKDSLQYHSQTLHHNIVQELIDAFMLSHPTLAQLKTTKRKSGFFLTHDIDTIFGAKNQNGDYALKTHQYHKIPGLLWRHYTGQPDWLNMDRIMDLEDKYGFQSSFFWLTRKDKHNADYNFLSPQIAQQISRIRDRGFENGLHKCIGPLTMNDELKNFNLVDTTKSQRYHFLKFTLPEAWQELERSDIILDTSLGHSQDYGFRNGYGLPFMPYNVDEKRVYDLIEVPMNIMDGSFFYQGKTVKQAEKELISWLDANKEETIVTINFHNNFFDDMLYAGYEALYEVLLRYFQQERWTCMTQASLITEFYRPDLFSATY
ncbi:MAG: hypothetical protein JSS76_03240 [Bacteroidetes bacterium]|nr:hypothetical protein [Bacteroidota bacterium]